MSDPKVAPTCVDPPPLAPSRVNAVLGVGLVSLGLLAGGCGSPGGNDAVRGRADVVLVTIDTLRGDRWGCVGDPEARTPTADRLARGGGLWAEGRAPSPVTLPSHASLMTGLPPAVHGVRDNAIFRLDEGNGRTVAEEFRDAGWTTAAFVSSFPLMSRFGLDRGFDRYDDALAGSDATMGHFRERTADQTVDAVSEWLSTMPLDPAPLFAWVHFFDPHAEYRAPDPWSNALHSTDTEEAYAAEVAFTDWQLGRLCKRLDDVREGRRRIVCLVADHGEGLGDHNERSHGVLLHATTIRVPIVVDSGDWAPVLITTATPIESVPATLLHLAGLDSQVNSGAAPILAEWSGPVHAETLYPFFNFGWGGLRSREEGNWRLVAGPEDRLYRMDTDPGETRNVAAEHPNVVDDLRAGLEEEWSARREAAFRSERRALSEDEIEALRSIGYLAVDTGVEDLDAAFEGGDDPETRIGLVDRINRGITLFDTDPVRCLEVLRPLLEEDPGNRLALEYTGRAFLRIGEPVRARRALRLALSIGRNPVSVHLDLARAEQELGNRVGQQEALQGAMAVDPRSVPARQALAEMMIQDQRFAEALPILQGALDVRPRAVGTHFQLALVYEALDRPEQAREHWQTILDIRPTGPVADRARAALKPTANGGAP